MEKAVLMVVLPKFAENPFAAAVVKHALTVSLLHSFFDALVNTDRTRFDLQSVEE